jgi:hypothetical protein
MLRAVERAASKSQNGSALSALLFGLVVALVGCAGAAPPLHWAQGGAPVDVPRARWTFGETVTEIDDQGRIKINGDPQFTLDRVGRVFDGDGVPVALLERDGRVVGGDEVNLGFVGRASASLPGERRAWLTALPSGEIVRFDDDGERHPFGVWIGECSRSQSAEQACMLVTHLLGMRLRHRGFEPGGVSIGVGLGVGLGR